MGCEIVAGDEEIAFTDGAFLVSRWCNKFTPQKKGTPYEESEKMGVISITEEAVRVANTQVPFDYKEAKELGLLEGSYHRDIDEQSFQECRDFLKYAAENNHGISGSY